MEICKHFGITDKTLTRWCKDTYGLSFSEAFEQERVVGFMSLRSAMFKRARSDDKSAIPMLIWLSKQYLGMKEPEKTSIVNQIIVDPERDVMKDLSINELRALVEKYEEEIKPNND